MQHQFNDGQGGSKFAKSKARRSARLAYLRRVGFQSAQQGRARNIAPIDRPAMRREMVSESAQITHFSEDFSSTSTNVDVDTRSYCLPDFEAPATMQAQTLLADYEQTEQGRLLCVQTVCCTRASGVRWIAEIQGVEVVEDVALRSSYVLRTGDGQKMISPNVLHLRCDKAALARILAHLERYEAACEENAPIWPAVAMQCLSIKPLPCGAIKVQQNPVSLSLFRRCFQEWVCRRWYDIKDPAFSVFFFGFKFLNCKPGPDACEPTLEPLFNLASNARHECAFDLTDALTLSYWVEFLSEYPQRREQWQALIAREGEPLVLMPDRAGCRANG